jgi:hypothetical protein
MNIKCNYVFKLAKKIFRNYICATDIYLYELRNIMLWKNFIYNIYKYVKMFHFTHRILKCLY